jgi:FkbM family methyltransferase
MVEVRLAVQVADVRRLVACAPTCARRASHLTRRITRAVAARRRVAKFERKVPLDAAPGVITIGDLSYGGYQLPGDLLEQRSIVLSAGAGTDVSFESLLVDRYGCSVHLLDPVPAAAEYVASALAHERRISFERAALWNEDTELAFHAPVVSGFVSHSATDMHRTAMAFMAKTRSVASLRAEHGWSHIDLLKISAEGAEFNILESIIEDQEPITALCVEFAQPAAIDRVVRSIQRLDEAGYVAVARSLRPFGWKMAFVNRERIGDRGRGCARV